MHRLGVVVPFRNRWEHLDVFFKEVIPYLTNSKIDFRVIVVEQDDASAFNRGMLCNIGFLQAKKLHCDYVVFHDVDMIPLDVDYSFSEHPVHLASDELPFDTYFGGITLFPVPDFEKINGFSNHYWGWGFEDDDLRYRCDKARLNYGIAKKSYYQSSNETVVLNGVDAYIEVENKLSFVRDFAIEMNIRIGDLDFDKDKPTDNFPIFTFKGNDLMLSYTSFNRFYLQWFDKNGKHYDLTSDIIHNRNNKITVHYDSKQLKMSLAVNDSNTVTSELTSRIYNYKHEPLLIGTNPKKSEFFKGAIDKCKIESNNSLVAEFNSKNLNNYSWFDTTKNSTTNTFINVEIKKLSLKEYLGKSIPHRRESKIKRLVHIDSGFINGRWKHDMTRWNQLRFNNEVTKGTKSHKLDGLSTCKFTQHSKERKGRVLHLKVGI